MKKYDNFFIPVDDLEMAKKYYKNIIKIHFFRSNRKNQT